MDAKVLYRMARAAALAAEKARQPTGDWVLDCAGYPAFIQEYNRLVPLLVEEYGDEAKVLFPPIDIGERINPAEALRSFWRTYMDMAVVGLTRMAAYLQDKSGQTDEQIHMIRDLIKTNLRAAVFADPENETDIQNPLEVIFRARDLDFRRETVAIEYSSKTYKPDFVFDSLDLALEVKLCATLSKEKALVDEINADIPAYQTKYGQILFVVFDMGFIRNVARFKSGIESNSGVHVMVIKK